MKESRSDIAISIIIPIYNSENHLSETLDSLCRQSFNDWQAICVDDGSTDLSADIVRSFISKDHRFTLIEQKNAGPGPARNKGLSLTEGEYVTFLDSDDLLHPQALEYMHVEAERTGSDIAIADYLVFDESGCNANLISYEPNKTEIYTDSLPELLEDWKKFRGHVWGKLFSRRVLTKLTFPALMSSEDTLFNIGAFIDAGKVIYIPKQLYNYRKRAGSLTHSIDHHKQTIDASLAISLFCIDKYKSGLLSESAMVKLIRMYGTNAMILHIVLMAGQSDLTQRVKADLIHEANRSISLIDKSTPFQCDIFSKKYFILYCLAVRPGHMHLLTMLSRIRGLFISRFET